VNKLLLIAVLVPLLFISLAQAAQDAVWIFGKTTGLPEEVTYQEVDFTAFNFSIIESNATWISSYPLDITVYAPINMMLTGMKVGRDLNVTGAYDNNSRFLAVTVEQMQNNTGWTGTLQELWVTVTGFGRLLVTLTVQLVEATTGYQLPVWTASLILLAGLILFFVRFGKNLPLILFILAFLVIIALVGYTWTTLSLI
jgi:hypothetical protein